ncbi:MAG TPA: hypothetical protein P5513_05890 [Candidatus Diapherotrites archaeon]|nr:hypothetical protein [Candidatus Diapherotrites archaeon]
MESTKIILNNKEYYVSTESLNNPDIDRLFLFEDPDLKILSKDISKMPRIIKKKDIKSIIEEGAGAGYAVWGGSRGGFGNPSLGGRIYGRGFGFGQSSFSNGGPNLMYTYSIKPLDPILQQKSTPQDNKRYIHPGSEVIGKVLGKNKKIHGKIISIKYDEDRNILYYIVQDFNTSYKFHVDPTSIELINKEVNTTDQNNSIEEKENFFPSFSNFLKEYRR